MKRKVKIEVDKEKIKEGLRFEERKERFKDRLENIDKPFIDLLVFFLNTETKAKIYLYLRKFGKATSQEIAKGTFLYPSSVREALVDLHNMGVVRREKAETEKVGKKPYIYEAIPPTELLKKTIGNIEQKLNELINLDRYLDKEGEIKHPKIPIRIKVVREETEKNDEEGNI
ncbi:MAG: helix-turn-helix domain-containing protein [Candidatus Hydrothermarchaeota archaeon]